MRPWTTAGLAFLILMAGCSSPPSQGVDSQSNLASSGNVAPWCEADSSHVLGDGCFCRESASGVAYCAESWNCGAGCPERARAAEARCGQGSIWADPADLAAGFLTVLVCTSSGDAVTVERGPDFSPGALDFSVVSSWSDARGGQTEHHWVLLHLNGSVAPGTYHVSAGIASTCDECAPQNTEQPTLTLDVTVPPR